jgi:ABC-type multidrug transport system fused ATPase/permease subunit
MLVANGISQAICGLALAWLLRDALHVAHQGSVPWAPSAGILSIGVAMILLRVREAQDAERLGQSYVTRVRLRIFDRLASRPTRDRRPGRWGVTMTRLISDLNSLRNWVSTGVARAIVASITASGLLLGLAWLSPWSSVGVVSMTVLCVTGAAALTPRLRSLVRESRRRRGRLANNLGERILALPTVRELGRSREERARVRSHSVRLSDALVRRVGLASALRSLPDVTMPLAIAGVALAAAFQPEVARESVTAVLLLGLIASALRDLARAWDHRLAFEEGRRRIEQILEGPRLRERREARVLPGDGPLRLELQGVGVGELFDGLDLVVEPGERVLLLGASGVGKSSLLALAARCFDPDRGRIRLDDIPIKDLELDSLRASVQRVSVDLPLLRGTIADNVGYGLDLPDPETIDRVVEACGLDLEDALLPDGLETRVEEQGANLSDGLRARVALARACAIGPRMLLVDDGVFSTDPTAAAALERVLGLWPLTCVQVGTESQAERSPARVLELHRDGLRERADQEGGDVRAAGGGSPGR